MGAVASIRIMLAVLVSEGLIEAARADVIYHRLAARFNGTDFDDITISAVIAAITLGD